MDLLEVIQNDVLKQKEGEIQNQFFKSTDFRSFIETTHPNTDVSVELKMCCLRSERLKGGQGIRVTLIDEAQHGVFEPTLGALNDLTSLKQKLFLIQVTVWDAKGCKGTTKKTNIEFHPGGVYKFCHVDGVGFYANIAKGNVQFDSDDPYKVYEVKPPLKKRKASQEPTAHTTKQGIRSPKNLNDVLMKLETKDDESGPSVTTRSKRGQDQHP
ncbi:hypothetical protein V7S43_014271 [Phytophthora oleae]|uniref:Uncharacterized protein n=1 Tax=Phytophthora oleae TaxID=2107226 RepID=A0ABD3F185_9STRA